MVCRCCDCKKTLRLILAFLIQCSSLLTHGQIKPVTAPGAELRVLGSGFSFSEGPSCDRTGDVVFTDQPNNRIMHWSANDGSITTWLQPAGRANGTKFDRQGNLIACADENNQLWKIDRRKVSTVLVSTYQGKRLNGPNDVWIRPDGAMYITDPLYARPYWKRGSKSELGQFSVFFLSANRKIFKPVTQDLRAPNGIVGTPDGKYLFVSDIDAGQTWKYRVDRNGDLSDKKLFCSLGSDGMTLDDEGNLYLTGHGVTVFKPSGEQIQHIDVPENWTGNLCFAGQDRDLLFITASNHVYGIKMRVHGVKAPN